MDAAQQQELAMFAWICPECGLQAAEAFTCGQEKGPGHWHDCPSFAPLTPHTFVPAERIEVFPVGSVNVLTPDEARLLVHIAAEKFRHGDEEYERFDAILDRLAAWAEEANR